MARADSYLLVASIDFGTTFSGYAFSFKGRETDIKVNKNWGDAQGFLSYKTPTSVLLDSKGEFEAFGFKAEQLYMEEEDEEEQGATLGRRQLFRNFKMTLHSKKKVTTTSTVCSVGNHLFPAIEIFTHALRYLKDHLLDTFASELLTAVTSDMIRWVVTVPAIWSEQAKQFMREAAFRAGCISSKDSQKLIIALEPEAASFFCRHLDLAGFANTDDISFPSGTRYLVLDCGGGTNDMVVHEVIVDYNIKEICTINGGSHGGNRVNEKFIHLLEEMLGASFIKLFQEEEPEQWFNFSSRFERCKKTIACDGKSKIKVDLPYSFAEKYEILQQGKTFKRALNDAKEKGVSFIAGALVLTHKAVQTLFENTINHVVEDVKAVFDKDEIEKIDYIFMVGGFCESGFLQRAVKETFEQRGCRVLVPREAQLAVIKGAVLYGHRREQVVRRIARKTYGCDYTPYFEPRIHDASKRFTDSHGEPMCDEVFLPFVEIGQELDIGYCVQQIFNPDVHQYNCIFCIYSLDRKPREPVQYTDDPCITKLGTIYVMTPNKKRKMDRTVRVKMTFGSTELRVETVDETTGNKAHTTLDFLSE